MALRHDLLGALSAVREGLGMDRLGYAIGAGSHASALAIYKVVRSIGYEAKLGVIVQQRDANIGPETEIVMHSVCMFDDTEWDMSGNNAFECHEESALDEGGEAFVNLAEFTDEQAFSDFLAKAGAQLDHSFSAGIEAALESVLIDLACNARGAWGAKTGVCNGTQVSACV